VKSQEEPSSKDLVKNIRFIRKITKRWSAGKVAILDNRANENRFVGFTFTLANKARMDLDDGFPSSGPQKNKRQRVKL